MGEWLPKVLVAVEDKRFFSHGGVDFLALARAAGKNLLAGRVVSGASTISSQLVRLSVPRPRNYQTKIMEFIGAWKLERSLDKKTILEYYLNRAPFGGPIRGVEAASRIYFGKRAKDLSLGEAALLVGLLKGPTLYRPDRNPKAALKRRQKIIEFVAERTGFAPSLTALALSEPLPPYSPNMPSEVRHFADLAFLTLPEDGGIARSTLDMRVQRLLKQALDDQLRFAGERVTAAGIVVDNRDGSILAYVGNARFNPRQGEQWVDCALASRSPGSTLKPFVYMTALESGQIIPATLLADTPLRLGGVAPRNFDRLYRGPVSASTALADSLNTPAVRVLRMVGVDQALRRLRQAGFATLNRADEDYGDSLVLGAGEATLLELARAYSCLGNLGLDRGLILRRAANPLRGNGKAMPRPLERYGGSVKMDALSALAGLSPEVVEARRWKEASDTAAVALRPLPSGLARATEQLAAASGDPQTTTTRLYSEGASYLVAEILQDPGRLPFLEQLAQAREAAPVAFKTGTSYGLRDAWTAAYGPTHTVVVWFGRADGGPGRELVGIQIAAPVAIRVMRALTAGLDKETGWYQRPQSVGKVRVCALSGAASSAWCPKTRQVDYLPDVWRTVPCHMHVGKSGRTALVWPPELEDFNRKRFSQEDLSRSALIVSPLPGARYLLTPGGRRQPIALKAEGVNYPVYWYADGKYIGEQPREDEPLYWSPSGGTHRVSLLDARERISYATVEVTDLGIEASKELPLLE
jgi:penicillin-binding protein 1C